MISLVNKGIINASQDYELLRKKLQQVNFNFVHKSNYHFQAPKLQSKKYADLKSLAI
jgi:hypothetical protein